MDIQRIKYNHELLKNQIRLANQLDMVESEIDEQQRSCDHIIVRHTMYSVYSEMDKTECLICGAKEKLTTHYPIIDTKTLCTTPSLTSDFELPFLQQILIDTMTKYPELEIKEIISLMQVIINNIENEETKKIRENLIKNIERKSKRKEM